MIQICRKDKEKVYDAIRTGKIDAAELSFPNLIDDIILTMKKHELLSCALLPAKENMTLFQDAVRLAIANGKWQKHPNQKRKKTENPDGNRP